MPDLGPLVPSILLTVAALAVLLTDLLGRGRRPVVPAVLAIAGFVTAGLVAWGQAPDTAVVFGVLRAELVNGMAHLGLRELDGLGREQ